MGSFANLKRSSSDLSRLSKAIDDANAKIYKVDEREWRLSTDKAGNGHATIRFLPVSEADGEDGIPWVRIFTHGFKGPGGAWYIENCPTTIGKECPVCEHNSTLWNSGEESNKKLATSRKRKLIHISNVLVISDPVKSENDGTVRIFKYGKKIFDKINAIMHPDEGDGEAPVNPFDLWKGANFKLKAKKEDGYPSYNESKFLSPSALFDGDDVRLEQVWKKEHALKPLVAENVFKTYDELKKRLEKVLGSTVQKASSPPESKKQEESESLAERFAKAKQETTEKKSSPKEEKTSSPKEEEGDDMKWFQDLTEE